MKKIFLLIFMLLSTSIFSQLGTGWRGRAGNKGSVANFTRIEVDTIRSKSGTTVYVNADLVTLLDVVFAGGGAGDSVNFDANTFVVSPTNNRVGIGTASPTQQLSLGSTVYENTIQSSTAEGLANADLRIGLSEKSRVLVITDSSSINMDYGLAAASNPIVYVFTATGSDYASLTSNTLKFSNTAYVLPTVDLWFQTQNDVSSGDMYKFSTTASSELTATTGTQSFMSSYPKINQASGDGNSNGLFMDITPTALGSGNHYMIDLQVSSTSQFSADHSGNTIQTGQATQETYVIRKHVALSGATDDAATNFFTITTADETGSADGGAYSITVHLMTGEATAASGAVNTASVSLVAHWTRIMASAGTGANSAIVEISESASADEGSGAISAVTLTVAETSEFVQQVSLQVNTSGGTFDGFALVELVYSDFTTAPTIQ